MCGEIVFRESTVCAHAEHAKHHRLLRMIFIGNRSPCNGTIEGEGECKSQILLLESGTIVFRERMEPTSKRRPHEIDPKRYIFMQYGPEGKPFASSRRTAAAQKYILGWRPLKGLFIDKPSTDLFFSQLKPFLFFDLNFNFDGLNGLGRNLLLSDTWLGFSQRSSRSPLAASVALLSVQVQKLICTQGFSRYLSFRPLFEWDLLQNLNTFRHIWFLTA